MPKLRVLSGREVRAILEAHGFVFQRQNGSHMILRGPGPDGIEVTISVPDHKTLAIGTLASIIRQSGIPRSEFEA